MYKRNFINSRNINLFKGFLVFLVGDIRSGEFNDRKSASNFKINNKRNFKIKNQFILILLMRKEKLAKENFISHSC